MLHGKEERHSNSESRGGSHLNLKKKDCAAFHSGTKWILTVNNRLTVQKRKKGGWPALKRGFLIIRDLIRNSCLEKDTTRGSDLLERENVEDLALSRKCSKS